MRTDFILNIKIHGKCKSLHLIHAVHSKQAKKKNKTKKLVNKLTHKINNCMTSMTFLGLDVALTPPVGVASGL